VQADRLGQRHPHREIRALRVRRDRLGLKPEGLVEPQRQTRPETARKRRPRQRDQVGDPAQPQPVKRTGGVVADPERRNRQAPKPLGQSALGDDPPAMARQRMSAAIGARDGAVRGEPGALQPRVQIGAQRRLAAKEMRHAADVGHQPVGAVAPDHRRIASGPAAQRGEGARLAHKIGGAGGEIGVDRAGVGERHAAPQTARLGGDVQAVNMIGAPRPQGEGEGPFTGAPPQDGVARQPRKPDGKQPTSHPSAASNLRVFLFCSL